jgi:hypothetical protein
MGKWDSLILLGLMMVDARLRIFISGRIGEVPSHLLGTQFLQ